MDRPDLKSPIAHAKMAGDRGRTARLGADHRPCDGSSGPVDEQRRELACIRLTRSGPGAMTGPGPRVVSHCRLFDRGFAGQSRA